MSYIAGREHVHLDEFTNELAQVTVTCPMCSDKRTFDVSLNGLHNWVIGGATIQRALPELDASHREALMTGICDTCWPSDE